MFHLRNLYNSHIGSCKTILNGRVVELEDLWYLQMKKKKFSKGSDDAQQRSNHKVSFTAVITSLLQQAYICCRSYYDLVWRIRQKPLGLYLDTGFTDTVIDANCNRRCKKKKKIGKKSVQVFHQSWNSLYIN